MTATKINARDYGALAALAAAVPGNGAVGATSFIQNEQAAVRFSGFVFGVAEHHFSEAHCLCLMEKPGHPAR
jgi:hypothetical protein